MDPWVEKAKPLVRSIWRKAFLDILEEENIPRTRIDEEDYQIEDDDLEKTARDLGYVLKSYLGDQLMSLGDGWDLREAAYVLNKDRNLDEEARQFHDPRGRWNERSVAALYVVVHYKRSSPAFRELLRLLQRYNIDQGDEDPSPGRDFFSFDKLEDLAERTDLVEQGLQGLYDNDQRNRPFVETLKTISGPYPFHISKFQRMWKGLIDRRGEFAFERIVRDFRMKLLEQMTPFLEQWEQTLRMAEMDWEYDEDALGEHDFADNDSYTEEGVPLGERYDEEFEQDGYYYH